MTKHNNRNGVRPEAEPEELLSALNEAAALIDRKRWEEAVELLEDLDVRYPRNALVLARLAQVYAELELMIGYEDACEQLLELLPDRPEIWLTAAAAYVTNRRPVLALRTFRRFLDRWPAHPEAKQVRTVVAELAEREAEWLADLDLTNPGGLEIAALHERVEALCERDRFADAQVVAEQIVQQRPDFVTGLASLARIHAAQGRVETAIELDHRALQYEPDNLFALGDLARNLLLSGRMEDARAAGDRLRSLPPRSPGSSLERLRALAFLGDDEGVLAVCECAERAGHLPPIPECAEAFHLAAVAAWRLDRTGPARAHWRRALDLDEHLAVARENVDDLNRSARERHAPWPFALGHWVPAASVAGLLAMLQKTGAESDQQAATQAVRDYLAAHGALRALLPVLLDRGDPSMREMALQLAILAATPETGVILRDFAVSRRGPDAMRLQAASAAARAGALPSGPLRMWRDGAWSEGFPLGFTIHGDALEKHRPRVEALLTAAIEALMRQEGKEAERLLKQALAVEPSGSPGIWNNLAMAYAVQGRTAEAEALHAEIHARYPEYLFGCAAMAHAAVERGDLQAAHALLDPLFGRPRLHHGELAALCGAEMELLLAENRRDAARSLFDGWAELSPNHPALSSWAARLAQPRQARRRFSRTLRRERGHNP